MTAVVSIPSYPRWYSSRSPGIAWPIQAQSSISVSGRGWAGVKAVVGMASISMSPLYSRGFRTVPPAPEPAHGELEPEPREAAVEGGAGDPVASGQIGDGAGPERGAETPDVLGQVAEGAGHVATKFGVLGRTALLAMPGCQPVRFR